MVSVFPGNRMSRSLRFIRTVPTGLAGLRERICP